MFSCKLNILLLDTDNISRNSFCMNKYYLVYIKFLCNKKIIKSLGKYIKVKIRKRNKNKCATHTNQGLGENFHIRSTNAVLSLYAHVQYMESTVVT